MGLEPGGIIATILSQVTDLPGLTALLFPGRVAGPDGKLHVGDIDNADSRHGSGGSFVVWPEAGRWYEANGAISGDLVDVVMSREGCDAAGAAAWIRAAGFMLAGAGKPRPSRGAGFGVPPPPPPRQRRGAQPPTWTRTPPDFTVADLKALPAWFLCRADVKGPLHVGGIGWSHSRLEGVHLARYGGAARDKWGRPLQLQPWGTYSACLQLGQEVLVRWGIETVPSLSLAGAPETLSLGDLVVCDVDYKPAEDDGVGAAYVDRLKYRLDSVHIPWWPSRSWNGLHTVIRAEYPEEFCRPNGSALYVGKPLLVGRPTPKLDVFRSGAKSHVVLYLDRRGIPDTALLPRLTRRQAGDLFRC